MTHLHVTRHSFFWFDVFGCKSALELCQSKVYPCLETYQMNLHPQNWNFFFKCYREASDDITLKGGKEKESMNGYLRPAS